MFLAYLFQRAETTRQEKIFTLMEIHQTIDQINKFSKDHPNNGEFSIEWEIDHNWNRLNIQNIALDDLKEGLKRANLYHQNQLSHVQP